MQLTANQLTWQRVLGFESRPLRQFYCMKWPQVCVHKIFSISFLILLGLVIYSNTFYTPFQFDDDGAIVNNPLIRDIHNVSGSMGRNARVVGVYTFAINYYLHKLDVFGYHAGNFLIHIITALLVWCFMCLLLSVPCLKHKKIIRHKTTVGFLTALLFLSHPVQTQAVTYLAQRFASLATLFYVLSLCFYIKGRLVFSKKLLAVFCFLLSAIAAIAGMYTKGIVMTLPLVIILMEVMFLSKGEEGKIKLPKFWGIYVIFILSLMLIVPRIFSFGVFSFHSSMPSESHLNDIITSNKYFLTQFRVATVFIRLLFFPFGQNLDYDFPLSQSLFEFSTLGAVLFIMSVIFLAIKIRSKYPLISFGIFWFFLTFSVQFIPRANIIAEHKLYLLSIGFCIALCVGIYEIAKNIKEFKVVVSVIIIIFSFLTFQRNKVWKDEITLWQDVVKGSPNKPRGLLNLGKAYADYGQPQLALKYYDEVIKVDSRDFKAYNNKGNVYYRAKQFSLALKNYNEALAINKEYLQGYINRAVLYTALKKYALALIDYKKAFKIRPAYNLLHFNWANTYARMKEYDLAIEHYTRAIRQKMEYSEVFRNRGNAYKLKGKYDLAIADYDKAIEMEPRVGIAYFHRSLAYQAKGNIDQAIKDALYSKTQGYSLDDRYLKILQSQNK